MTFNPTEMMGSLRYGGARPSHFKVEILNPIDGLAGADIPLRCHSTSQPPSEIGKTPVYYFGRELKLPGDRSYADWTVSFYEDEDYRIRNSFVKWSNACNANVQNRSLYRNINNLISNINFHKLAKDNSTIVKTIVGIGIWPTLVGDIRSGWEMSNQIETFDVTFSINAWYDLAATDAP